MFIARDLENFSYEDCVIRDFRLAEDDIIIVVDALIVLPGNSQNKNYTRSYASAAEIHFFNAAVEKGIKEGCRRFDADDNLIEEIPDQLLMSQELATLLEKLKDTYLYDLKQERDTNGLYAVLGIEFPTEDITGIDADSYQIKVRYQEVTVSWERYLNRVE